MSNKDQMTLVILWKMSFFSIFSNHFELNTCQIFQQNRKMGDSWSNIIDTSKLSVKHFLIHISHYVKCARIWSYSCPYFHAFGLNSERYGVSLRIQSECGKMRTRITPNTDTFYPVSYD